MLIRWLFTVVLQVTDLEVTREVTSQFETRARTVPTADPALGSAARMLARAALDVGPQAALALSSVTLALSAHQAWDANPAVFIVRGSAMDLKKTLSGQRFAEHPQTHFGVGVVRDKNSEAFAVVLSARVLQLAPFSRVRAVGTEKSPLCVTVAPAKARLQLFITRPNGSVDEQDLPRTQTGANRSWCADICFDTPGRHTLEILVTDASGPRLGALFFVQAGPASAETEKTFSDVSAAQAPPQILAQINRLRLVAGRAPLANDAALDDVAQAYAERMRREGFFSHFDRDGNDLKVRLKQAKYAFQAAGENLAHSSGPLAAHFGIEHSPAHRANLLDSGFAKCGIGLAVLDDGQTLLVEVFTQLAPSHDPLAGVLRAIAERRGTLKTLHRNQVLEGLAQVAAMARARGQNTSPKLTDQALEALPELTTVASDVFISEAATIGKSKNLANASFSEIGVGLAQSAEGLWYVVIVVGA
jgi:uncharacterized protein YkwD